MRPVAIAGAVVTLLHCSLYTTAPSSGEDAGAGTSSGQPSADASLPSSASSGASSSSGASVNTPVDSGSASSSGGPVLAGFALEMLTRINEVRATASPTPSPPLAPLAWDPAEAARLQTWADACVDQAPGTPGGRVTSWGAGANGLTPDNIMALWLTARSQYDYAENQCNGPSQCASYKAMVQRSVTKLGCAISTCTVAPPSDIESSTWHLFACGYATFTDPSLRPYEVD